ncbi:hypothetical protein A3Q56_02783, partial [Intoshia linei]
MSIYQIFSHDFEYSLIAKTNFSKFAFSDEEQEDDEEIETIQVVKTQTKKSKKPTKKVAEKKDDPFADFINVSNDPDSNIDITKQKKLEKKKLQKMKKLESANVPTEKIVKKEPTKKKVDNKLKKKPVTAQVKEMQRMLQLKKDEEERIKNEHLELVRLAAEEEIRIVEEEKLAAERREREKIKKREKIEQQKKDGTFLTDKQKKQKKLLQARLDGFKEAGMNVPEIKDSCDKTENKPFPKYSSKNKHKKKKNIANVIIATSELKITECEKNIPDQNENTLKEKCEDDALSSTVDETEWECVKERWDEDLDIDGFEKIEDVKDSDENKDNSINSSVIIVDQSDCVLESKEPETIEVVEENVSLPKCLRPGKNHISGHAAMSVEERVQFRRETDEKNISKTNLRSPIVCVLGHVDTGKTKLLDKMRRTKVQEGEAGGITQQIGATNVPLSSIIKQISMVNNLSEINIPGLLIIDTPGHESFSNLRNRGSSLCDIAILVVDIMHGLEPQTKESIHLLKNKKIPFVIALNKVDRIYGWKSNARADIVDVINSQPQVASREFRKLCNQVIAELSGEELNTILFYENTNTREFISIVPTSAHSGDGIGNLIALICSLTQTFLNKAIRFREELEATVMEVQNVQGFGMTLDVIMVNGKICEGDNVVIAASDGSVHTHVKAILTPQPMKELRIKSTYIHHKELVAAHGMKLVCRNVENAVPGMPLYLAHYEDEIPYYKKQLDTLLKSVLSSYKLQEKGVFVQASTLGSLEALLQFLRTSKIPYAGISIGTVYKKDVIKASVMTERAPKWAMILAFDVMVEPAASELAGKLGVKLFCADIIYHLFDRFIEYQKMWLEREKAKVVHLAIFPCKLAILPNCIFNKRQPLIIGVVVEEGSLRKNTPLMALSKDNGLIHVGIVMSIEINHKDIPVATVGMEVCIKIYPKSGQTPELYGRHFAHPDSLYSKITRESIDVLKEFYRDEMKKADWINKCNVDDKNFYVNELKDSENKKVHRENSNPVKSKGSISSLIQDYGNKITLLEKKNHDYIEIIQNYDSSNLHAKNILLHHGYDSNILDLTIDDQILYFIKEKEKWDSENFKEFEQEINKKNSKISQYESTIQKLEVTHYILIKSFQNLTHKYSMFTSRDEETDAKCALHNCISSFERKLEYDDKKINEMEKYKREIKDKIKSYDEMINDLKVDKKNMLEQLNEKNSENDNLEKLLEIESQKSIKLSKILADTNQSMNDYILKFNKTTSVIEDYETQILELKKTNIEYKTFNDKNGNIIDNLKQIITSNNVKSEQQQTENIQLKKIAQDLDDDKKLILKNSQVYQINQENIIKELFEKDRQNNDHISMLSQKSDVILELRKKYNKNKNVLTGNKKEIDKLQCIILKTEQDLKEQLYLKENLSQEVNRLNLIIEAKTSELSKNIEKQESIIKDFDILKCKKIKLESDLNSMKQIFKEKVKSLDVDNEKTKNENDELFNKLTYLNEK